MSDPTGRVVALYRYPVKSMMGEELNATDILHDGLLGDRAYALIDRDTGKVVSAKNPKLWPDLFQFRASFVRPPTPGVELPAVRIMLPDGASVTSDDPEVNTVLSAALGRSVALQSRSGGTRTLEEYWPTVDGLAHNDEVTDEAVPEGTFFDYATAHLLTTSTLNALRELYPQGRFEVRRFRPNLVVETRPPSSGFVENAWVGAQVTVGTAQLDVIGPCPRCVMTRLAQSDLPQDLGILKTAAKHNDAHVGIYTATVQAGRVKIGDFVTVRAAAVA